MAGAGFPTGVKLQAAAIKSPDFRHHAAECEPYITADDRLDGDCAAQIVASIRIPAHILQPREVLIGIEDNKPQVVSMLRAVLAFDAHDFVTCDPNQIPLPAAQTVSPKY